MRHVSGCAPGFVFTQANVAVRIVRSGHREIGITTMMTYQEFQSKLGSAAHEAATQQYLRERHERHLFHHDKLRVPSPPQDFSVRRMGDHLGNAILRKDLNDPYLGTLIMCLQTRRDPAWPLEYSEPGKARQPDLACIELHEAYEIKPNNPPAINSGRQQLGEFIDLLSAGDREWRAYSKSAAHYRSPLGSQTANLRWTRGISFLPKPTIVKVVGLGEVGITYRPREAGLIVWEANADPDRLREPVLIISRELAVHLKRSIVATEELAARWAREKLQSLPELVPLLQTLSRVVGLAMAVVLLSAAIALVLVQVPAAIVFAVCLAICLRATESLSQPRPVGIRLT